MINNGSQILLALSDRSFAPFAAKTLRQAGLSVATTDDAETVTRAVGRLNVDVVLLDLDLPGRDPLELIAEVRGAGLAPEVIVTSAEATFEQAVEAMRRTAFDFIRQPIGAEALVRTVSHAVERHRLARENTVLRRVAAQQPFTGPIVSASQRIQDVLHKLKTVAASRAPVLFTGETGTGKGLMAKTLHLASGREPFLQINCGALQESLFESELFGHVRGAFPGAVESKPGLFEVADGGTIFLDEVSELKPVMQAKLLQVLDTQEIRPVGGTVEKTVDVRVVAATNGDLERESREGTFRQDLYFRLRGASVTLPPLRERGGDVLLLATSMVEREASRLKIVPVPRLEREAAESLARHSWPGNVRELENVVRVACQLAAGGALITPEHLEIEESADGKSAGSYHAQVDDLRRRLLRDALAASGGKRAEAARLLGLSRQALSYLIRELRIDDY